MGIETVLRPDTVTFIKDVGFPIASFVIMVSILMYVMKKDEKRQEKTESRYERLVDKFIETTNINVDVCRRTIDDKLEAQHISYIFKEDNDEKIGKENKIIKQNLIANY